MTESSALFRDPPLPPELPLVDIHVHLGSSDSGEIYYPTLRTGEYLKLMDEFAIQTACAFPPLQLRGYRDANASLLAGTRTSGGRILPFARVGGRRFPPTMWRPWAIRMRIGARLRRHTPDAADLSQFSGVKLLPHLDGLPDHDVLDAIAELELPVVVHGGVHSPPTWLERVLFRQLRVPIVVAHLGAFPCGEGELRDAVRMATRYDHVYLDTSAISISEFLRFAIERVPEKVVFGSDCPAFHPWVAWSHVASIITSDSTLEKIGRRTAMRILGLRDRSMG